VPGWPATRRNFYRIVLAGSILVGLGVLWQAFSIAAYIRSGDSGWLDAHLVGSFFVHAGQLAIVIGAIVAAWRNWRAVGTAVAFLALAVVQLLALGDTDKVGSWVNGFHGFLALVVMLAALRYAQWSARILGIRVSPGSAGGA
jgi:hypothetical protein